MAVDPNRLYPWNEDPDGILPSVYTNPNGSKSDADYESKIKSAGYLGFYITESSSNQSPHGNTAGLFYKVPVESVESRDSVRSELHGDKVQLNQKMSRAISFTPSSTTQEFLNRSSGDSSFNQIVDIYDPDTDRKSVV